MLEEGIRIRTIFECTSLLSSVWLCVRSTSNNTNGNKQVIYFPVQLGTMVIMILSYEPHSDTAQVTCSTDTDSHMTYSTEMDSCVTCSACSCKGSM